RAGARAAPRISRDDPRRVRRSDGGESRLVRALEALREGTERPSVLDGTPALPAAMELGRILCERRGDALGACRAGGGAHVRPAQGRAQLDSAVYGAPA